jgi:probable HAF family extracellular repeat protein
MALFLLAAALVGCSSNEAKAQGTDPITFLITNGSNLHVTGRQIGDPVNGRPRWLIGFEEIPGLFTVIVAMTGIELIDVNWTPVPMQRPGVPTASGQGVNCQKAATFDGENIWAVGFQDSGDGTPYHAVRTTFAGDFLDLGDLAGNGSFGTDVSSIGSVVGYSVLADGINEHAFLWTDTSGMVDLGSSSGPGGFSRAFGISADGSVVVGEEGDAPFSATNAFIWTAGSGFQDLGVGSAYAVTADGSTVIGQANYATAFLWTQASGMQDLGSLPSYSNSVATGVSDDGQVIVGLAAPRPIAYLDGPGFDYDIDCLPFVWTAATGMQDLNQLLANAGVDLTGISLYAITGISTDGQFVCGAGRTPQNDPNNPNETSGFIVQLP